MYSYGPPHMAVQKQDNQHEHTFSSYVRIQDVVLKTCLERLTIGRSGERWSGISVLPARHDDDDDESQIINNSWVWYRYSIQPKKKMTNQDIIQCGTQTGLCVIIGWYSLNSQHKGPDSILWILAILFFR